MPSFARLLTALIGALMALSLAQAPAMAASASGTHAFSTDVLVLRNGPGSPYAITGEIGAELAIKVLRCQRAYCLVDGSGERGWTRKHNITFGNLPTPRGVNPDFADDGTAACFYTGTHYSGVEFCVTPSQKIDDLALLGLDDSFASVRLTGRYAISICRDRFFQSYCERVVNSQPVLDQYLVRNLSSIWAR